MKPLLATLALALLASFTPAQNCPVWLSTQPSLTGTAPNYNFNVDGTAVADNGNIGIHVITPTLSAGPSGYINTDGGYGGCLAGWTYFINTTWTVTNLRTHFSKTLLVKRDGPFTCETYYCSFDLALAGQQTQLSLGEWQFQSAVYAEITSKEGANFYSPTYTGSITIEISAKLP